MQKFIVISDSHGMRSFAKKVFDMHSDADGIIFLGDGYDEISSLAAEYPHIPFYAVRGNCDRCTAPETLTLEAEGVKIMCMHGHTYGVKGGDGRLYALCDKGYDIVLHGHTHTPREDSVITDSGMLKIFNPGALITGKFGLLTIDDGAILTSHGDLL